MRRKLIAAGGALGLLISLGGAAGSASATTHRPDTQRPDTQRPATTASTPRLSFTDCGDGLQCDSLPVPADWARPNGERITLGLARLPARDQARKRGSLVLDLGGPDEQISYFRHREFQEQVASLRKWFDIVIFDPRGFGESAGIDCPPPMIEPDAVFPDRAAYDAQAARNRSFHQRCADAVGPLARHLDSWQVAHDMDAIRAALGERKLNYFGNSYGTVYGQAYAELFGHRVGRMYLDSVMDHTNRSLRQWLAHRAAATEKRLHRFADWCATESSCALHGRDPLAVWDDVIASAKRRPIPAPGAGSGVAVTAEQIVSRAAVRYERDWPALAEALADARTGDATKFAREPSRPGGGYLMRFVAPTDFRCPDGYRSTRALAASVRAVAPRLGWRQVWQWAEGCAGVPRDSTTFPPHRIRPRPLPPILIAGGEDDDVTPAADGRRLSRQLHGSRYLAADGGHALYLNGNACVREQVHRYLSTGHLPSADVTCTDRASGRP